MQRIGRARRGISRSCRLPRLHGASTRHKIRKRRVQTLVADRLRVCDVAGNILECARLRSKSGSCSVDSPVDTHPDSPSVPNARIQ
ncbi:hypothetical protein SL003B_1519 [Polymorphum gilvum SL003B-26A1]|uniref:Uncharacterized protein n=1 Tax=Polymorphum gilvum (strain LMG 25793 / CGMCC 1.9160 / SL003B-26A1) TaxID=991905 RepID=F2J421_POLGS|nr:hypothetical protein SL003B_1519 [Polymorphum gilvum SL003B-26A1]